MKKLGGVLFIKDGIKYDYCYRESISCLQAFCDEVIVIDAGSEDGTKEDLLSLSSETTTIISAEKELWHKLHGREKISYYQNFALSFLNTEYYFLLQGDEIVHENSFEYIRMAITGRDEAYFCSRINLWGDCNSYINVPENRQPCSTKVIRLAKTKYESVGDGEGIEAPANNNFTDNILIYHYGFVRKKEVMKSKVINMQENVFELGHHDPKLDKSEIFDSKLWFSGDELSHIQTAHPKFIQDWIKERP